MNLKKFFQNAGADLDSIMAKARALSYHYFGKRVSFYHPGMFYYQNTWGEYPAVSITGKECFLQCKHCQGRLLEKMPAADTPSKLVEICKHFQKEGYQGCLITGGSLPDGSLPWKEFIPAIREIKENTRLFLSAHTGLVSLNTALALKEAGLNQALLDIIGDDETASQVCHISNFKEKIITSLQALIEVSLPVIPHIVIGLDYGRIKGEYEAIDLVSSFPIKQLVFVVLMPFSNTPMRKVFSPSALEIIKLIIYARLKMPRVFLSLGCARARGQSQVEVLALKAGINGIALPSETTINYAEKLGLAVSFEKTCCSLSLA
jgi:hypothetical protein